MEALLPSRPKEVNEGSARRPQRGAPGVFYALKLVPQPQLVFALGFLKMKPAFIRSSE